MKLRLLASMLMFAVGSACGGGGSSGSPPAQGPQTWQLLAGASNQQEALQSLKFYQNTLTIDAGDTVAWTFMPGEPHTVTFLGPRATPPPPTDPTAPLPAGGTTYDGTTYTSSGFLLLGKTYALTFPTPGTYKYYCLLHGPSGMIGTIVVQNAGAPYPPTQTAQSSAYAAQIQTDLAQAQSALSQFPYTPGGTQLAAGLAPGLSTGPPSPVTILRFLNDANLSATSVTVAAGSTITWTNQSNNEPH
ncbi:MAG: plastocyanin/azurin family copper-binding protein, partial [Candidatus Eremiobacteraeota bacterium]|nr:plastocyanin/azurin family copper-binding protein [Candidatus Eremiobacteraeota bacterium]